jgi:hypothetical protein
MEESYHNCSLGISMYALRVQKNFEIDLFRKIILLCAMLSRKTLTLGRRSICLLFLVDNAISSSVLDT